MFLNKIEMKGFKSFADRIEIDFISGITCIVGPNGSGKSNITDAIRWVLGEQKARILRGAQMQDIIFNGTNHRKPLNFAEVALYFDNSTNFFNSDFLEISVRRRLHRSGESEYFLNEAPCRLKDVKELIMDTGIGTDGYSIIGQGNIDNILSDNKFDRRLIFEEAAGIVKFNSKKTESEKRLLKVDDNIDRINDIIGEVSSRIEPLKEESEKAQEFLEIEKKVKESEIKYLLDEYDAYKKKNDEKEFEKLESEKILNELVEEKKVIVFQQQNSHEILKTLKSDNEKSNQQYDILSKEKDGLTIDVKVREEKIANKKKEIKYLEETIKSETNNLTNLQNNISQKFKEKEVLENQQEVYEKEIADLEGLYTENLEAFRLNNSDKNELMSKLIELRSDVNIYNAEKKSSHEYVEKLHNKAKEALLLEDEANKNIENSTMLFKENNLKLKNYNEQIENNETILKIKVTERDQLDEKLYQLKSSQEEMSRLKYRSESEIELFENMEKNYEGLNYNVKKILQYIDRKNLNKKIIGIVADLIKIPEGYEEAIATALGKSATQIVTDNEEQAKEIIKQLKNDRIGRATFLPLSFLKVKSQSIKLNERGFLGFARDIISFDSKYDALVDYLLGKTIIVDNIDNGIFLSKKLTGYYKIVTLDGDVIITNGPITGGSKGNKNDNIFKRKQELDVLKTKVDSYKKQLDEIENQRNIFESKIILFDDEIRVLKNQLIETKNLKISVETDNLVLVRQLENDNKVHERLKNERKGDLEEIETEENHCASLDDTIKELSAEISKIEGILHHTTHSSVDEKKLKSMEEQMTQLKIEYAKIDENIRNISNTLDDYEIQQRKTALKIDEWSHNLETENNQLYDDLDLLDNKRNELGNLNEAINHFELKRSNYKRKINDIESELEDSSNKLTEVENSTNDIRQLIHEIELEMAKLDVKVSNLSNNLWNQREISIVEARIIIENTIDFISKNELNKLKKRMKEIEHVNLDSIQEYQMVQERYEFLSTQLEDLVSSKSELTKFIKQMELKIVKSFKDTFNQINESFKIVFAELFGGGHGEIVLTDPTDVLGTDINIMASPPGKKMQNINLLSGGEKALTAIALLFSVLKAKPTPFCVLDEIEAALDDSNVYKFGHFLREFSTESQFILITHRKGTMEYADALYGVSMEEYGISKVISLKLSDFDFQEELDA
ncbi:MAG: chromosome segregation protein SMC [Clostridiales bacterium]|nr:chromosome segregation protein SMC [Clostridiales bacterium]